MSDKASKTFSKQFSVFRVLQKCQRILKENSLIHPIPNSFWNCNEIRKTHTDPKFQMEIVLLVNGLNFDSNIIMWQEMKCDGIKWSQTCASQW